jgi:hypothetical protein
MDEPERPSARLTGDEYRGRHRYRSHLSARQHRRDRRFHGGRIHGRMVHGSAAQAPRMVRRRVTYQAAPNVIVDAAKAMHVLEAPAGPWGGPELF